MNTHCILTTLKTEDYEANYYQYPGMQLEYDVIYIWPLKSGNVLISSTQFKAEDKLHHFSFLLLNPRKQTIKTLREFTTPIATVIAGKTFLQYLLPESAMLTEIKDEIINLSEEEKFMYRAICLGLDVFMPNIPSTEMNLSGQGERRAMRLNIRSYLDHIQFFSIKLTANLFGIFKDKKFDVYKQAYNPDLGAWAIEKQYSCLSNLENLNRNCFYPIDANSFVLYPCSSFYKVNFKATQSNAEFNAKKLQMPDDFRGPLGLGNNYFYYVSETHYVDDMYPDYSLHNLDLTTMLSEKIPIFLPRGYEPIIYGNFVLDKPYLICDVYNHSSLSLNSYICDPSNATYHSAKFWNNCDRITMLSDYSFLTLIYKKNSIALIKFPRWNAWLTQVKQTLNEALDKSLIPPLISIVGEYLNHDIATQQCFFNSKNSFTPKPTEDENKPPSCLSKCTIQ